MDWAVILLLFLFCLILVMFTGLPVAFSFLLVSSVAIFVMSGVGGLKQLVLGMQSQLSNFNFTPIPFFVIMGEVFFQSGIIVRTMNALSRLVRKVPGRLSVITMLGGGIFAALSGSSLANTAMFGSLMQPEMSRRNYSKEMTTGTIMASGALAMVIPPSNQAVMMGGIANISVSRILMGAVLPGLLLLLMYIGYIVVRCVKNPSLAPRMEEDDVDQLSTVEKLTTILRDIAPLLAIFLVVIGVIFLGIGTATEAAAIGTLASYLLTIAYKKFSLKLLANTLLNSLKSTSMLMIIIASSAGFSQVLSFTGASRQAVLSITSTIQSPVLILVAMLVINFIMGLFIEQASIMMICLPLFMPLVHAFGIDEIKFAVLFLILLEVGQFTPPVGMSLFVMKSVSPKDVTMPHIIRGAIPFVIIDIVAVLLIAFVSPLTSFLPNLIIGGV